MPFNDAEIEPEKMIANLRNQWLDPAAQRRQLDALQALNREYSASFGTDAYLEGRIKSMETAYRMQFEAMDVFDIRKEPEAVRDEYGKHAVRQRLSAGAAAGGARRALRPRLLRPGQPWDDHNDINEEPDASAAPIWTRRPRR